MSLKYKFRDRVTQLNKFEDLYERYISLRIRMTQPNKFRYLNGHFTSLETGMTYPTGDGLYSSKYIVKTKSLKNKISYNLDVI